jgi:anthranilate/para-aminobenzoate synthase component II
MDYSDGFFGSYQGYLEKKAPVKAKVENNTPKKKVVLAKHCEGVEELFKATIEIVKEPDAETKLIIFGGGTDVNPALYGRSRCKFTGSPDRQRDKEETELFEKGVALGIPMVGICRGAQLLCALNGGELIQHVDNHSRSHGVIYINDGYEILTTSLHHQMMYPYTLPKSDYRILAMSSVPFSNTYIGEDNKEMWLPKGFVEPEVVYFPKTKSLGFQNHPEMELSGSYSHSLANFRTYCNLLILGRLDAFLSQIVTFEAKIK